MKREELLKFDFVKEHTNGDYSIFISKATNTIVLNKVLYEIQKTHKLYRIFDDVIKAVRI